MANDIADYSETRTLLRLRAIRRRRGQRQPPTTHPHPNTMKKTTTPNQMPPVVEYHQLKDGTLPQSQATVISTTTSGGTHYRIEHDSPGYTPAGSAARWTSGGYAVRFSDGRSTHGRCCLGTLKEAQQLLDKWTRTHKDTHTSAA